EEKVVEDLLVVMTALVLQELKMVEDLLVVMVETAEMKEDIRIKDLMVKTDHQNVNQENLEPLENHVETALDMHITAHQNLYSNLTERIRG
ncbi:MAG: hypothetical protein HN923_04920, partial [Euryarchaeota archaeon]|nr:hypothetical protein [Euryarchaeota archaeon]